MKSRITFFFFFLLARASSVYLLIGCEDDAKVEQFITTYITAGKYQTKEEDGLFLVDVEHSNNSCGKPMQIISTHPTKSKEYSMIALLEYIGYGAIDGVLTAVENEDERVDLIRELHLTTVPHRQLTSTVLFFKQSGNHKFIHYGNEFTFIGNLENKMIRVNMVFEMSPKLRVMDTFWVYRRAHIEANYASPSRAIYENYMVSLFNCLVGHQLPLRLLVAAIQQENLKLITYLIDELPGNHVQVLKKLIKGLSELSAAGFPEFEVESPLQKLRMSYDPLNICRRYTGYHESFENIVSIRIRAIEEEVSYAKKKAEFEASIARLEDLETTAKADIETAGDMNNLRAHWIACARLDEIVSLINRFQEELEQLEKKHQEIMQSYKLQADEAYFI